MDFLVTEPPDALPVSVEDYIDHARLNALTVERQPSLIARELAAATERGQQYCRRSFLTQQLKALFIVNDDPLTMVLPRGPAQSVDSITSEGAALDPASYRLEWDTVILTTALAAPATVLYKAGYGDDPPAVPQLIREGILRYATLLYDNRTGQGEAKYEADAGRTLPAGVVDCWRPYQVELGG